MLPDILISTASNRETLVRIMEGKSISKEEAYELIRSAQDELILTCARTVRDSNRSNAKIVTYSRKIFIDVTNLCRDTCSYCTYKKDPYSEVARLMMPAEVIALAELGKKYGCTEALLVTGERPEQKYQQARDWLRYLGYNSSVEYVGAIGEELMKKTGLLPHTNAGSLTKKEMSFLKKSNVSLGMMLESSSQRLTKAGMPHHDAPSKNPKVRLRTLEDAGQLKIPFTTGLLLGIGETTEEVIDSLFAIKEINAKYGHIQEVILQNFMPKTGTAMEKHSPISMDLFLRIVGLARIILQGINIQVPPNLNLNSLESFLDAGINDWGGISPVTIDYVNPEFPWPPIETVRSASLRKGFSLKARLPIYPEFIFKADSGFVSDTVRRYMEQLCDSMGLVREELLN
jgi:7,8-didemethyl-8-hydroxy-5-deazariboflavin synthase